MPSEEKRQADNNRKKTMSKARSKKKSGFLSNHQFAIERLEQKIEQAESFLKERLGKLVKLRRERTEAFAKYEQEIEEARARLDKTRKRQAELEKEAEGLEADAEDLLEQAELCRIMANAQPVEQRTADAKRAESAYAEAKGKWRAIFRAQLDGRTRRKRHELARLIARREKRQEKATKLAERMPSASEITYGQSQLPDGTGNEKLGKCKQYTEAENKNEQSTERTDDQKNRTNTNHPGDPVDDQTSETVQKLRLAAPKENNRDDREAEKIGRQ